MVALFKTYKVKLYKKESPPSKNRLYVYHLKLKGYKKKDVLLKKKMKKRITR